MTREETKKCIEVMNGYVLGEEIEVIDPIDKEDIWQKTSRPVWNWAQENYRIKPEQTSISATEKELKRINQKTVWIKSKKNPEIMGNVLANNKLIDKNWLVFNPDTKCWEDWENEK